jgi:hypothetical protein
MSLALMRATIHHALRADLPSRRSEISCRGLRQTGTTGKSVKTCPSLRVKIFRFRSSPNHAHNFVRLTADEGRSRTSRTRGEMRWTRRRRRRTRLKRTTKSCGSDVAVLALRPREAKLLRDNGGKRAVLREEHEVSRKAIAQGRPECFRCTCMLVCISCYAQTAHETSGAASTRSSLRPLIEEGGSFRQASGSSCREIANTRSIVIARLAASAKATASQEGKASAKPLA